MNCPQCVAVNAAGDEHGDLFFEKPETGAVARFLLGPALLELAPRQQSESRWGSFPGTRAWRVKLASDS